MLSKPWMESSGGRRDETSMSSASRSRTAFAYSTRFSRCTSGRPGLRGGARPIERRFGAMPPSNDVARSGRRAPSGGIAPLRTFRTTFSHIAVGRGIVRAGSSSARPPVFARWLWQVRSGLSARGMVGAAIAAAEAALLRRRLKYMHRRRGKADTEDSRYRAE
jgi:hypothetical protein